MVSTLTQGERPQWLAQCQRSVVQTSADAHLLMLRPRDFVDARWACLAHARAQYVGFVDDDDYLIGDPVALCAQALDETGAGLAFTTDVTVDEHARPLAASRVGAKYEEAAENPYVLRQFTLVRRELICPSIRDAARPYGPHLLDWAIRSFIALRHGAVQIPQAGYARRCHPGGMSRRGFGEAWAAALPLRQSLLASAQHRGPIAVWGRT